MPQTPSTKRVAITKANAQMVGSVGIAAFLTVFSLVASHALWNQNGYLSRVIKVQTTAHKQLVANIDTSTQLLSAYQKFTSTPNNVIGGNAATTGVTDNDGDNAKIVLDALPSSYDFPALTSSIEKILTAENLKIDTITGTDDEVAQESTDASGNPQAVPMSFSFSISQASYQQVQDLINTLQSSIRPIQIDTMTLTGGSASMKLAVTAHTYYQPAKTLSITKKAVD